MTGLVLLRVLSTPDGVYGVMLDPVGNRAICVTLEPPESDNAPNRSCIPAGFYKCDIAFSPHFNTPLFHLRDVPGRTDILIHSGNSRLDTHGCILVGRAFDVYAPCILQSKAALEDLMFKYSEGVELCIQNQPLLPLICPGLQP